MARVLRGEIRWADLSDARGHEQAGRRPVLVISENVFNEHSGTVIALALTSQEPRAGFPLTVELSDVARARRSWVKISQVRTLAAARVGRLIGRAGAEEMAKVVEGLFEIVGK